MSHDDEREDVPAPEGAEPTAEELEDAEEKAVDVAKYKITGLVDKFDEQMNIIGTLEIGSEQELPVEIGDGLVNDGRAERVE